MKKSLTLTILGLFLVAFSFSQTTQEEYNYITKGYKVQVESGLDMKAGYSFQKINNATLNSPDGMRTTEFYYLMKTGSSKPVATMVTYTKQGNQTVYFCIPTPNASPDLWQKAIDLITGTLSIGSNGLHAMIYGLMQYSANQTQK